MLTWSPGRNYKSGLMKKGVRGGGGEGGRDKEEEGGGRRGEEGTEGERLDSGST